jgi:CO/xanthine dehydrogenase Mo-binding subunit
MISDLRGGLDDAGNIIAWSHEVWTPTHSTRPNGKPGNLLAGQLIDPPMEFAPLGKAGGTRNAPTNYAFPNQHVVAHWIKTPPLRPSALRSLGGVANTTANESFFDELVSLAGADPVEFRLRHLGDPRAIAVVERAATRFGWEPRVSTSQNPAVTRAASEVATGRGFAFVRYENEYTYVALAASVEVDRNSGEIRVNRVVVAHDCGRIINPDGLTNQIEGNVIQGISRALHEEVTFDRTQVTSLTLATYRILGFSEAPKIEVELIDRPEEVSWGAGEPTICPVRAAISNAVFDATGVRLRQAPYTPDRVLAALQGV